MRSKVLKLTAAILLFVLCFFAVQQLFMPKYMSGVYEGALIGEYYDDIKGNQVLFIGDCEVYENFSPITLWEEYGITSYIRGGPQQLIWQSYYLLEDTLRYETPNVVVFNVLAMKYDTPQNEAYNRLNIDGMRLSTSKLGAAQASMMPEESLLSYLLPILRYHERWTELTGDDLRYFFNQKRVAHNGYYMRNDVKPVGIIPEGARLADYNFGTNSYIWLDKITTLCKSKGIDLVLVKAPTIYPHWYAEWDVQMQDYAAQNSLLYLNFLNHVEEAGINFATDTYDAGLHLNLPGAEKLSHYFGQILKDNYPLQDLRQDRALQTAWEEKCSAYYAMRDAQLADLAAYGEIRTFTY